jgi:ATP-dependent exoDNAse (exonuclease V) alpha subunit
MRSGTTSGDVTRAYRDHDRVEDYTDIDTVIDRWSTGRDRGADVLLLAGRRDQVTALNRATRARLQAEGVVGARPVRPRRPPLRHRRPGRHPPQRPPPQRPQGTRGVITDIDDGRLRLRDGRRVNIPHAYAEAGWVDHGYALTIHKAQGLTAEETITLADDTLAREHAYVALSRGRLSNRLIVALADGFDEHQGNAAPSSPADRLTPILNRTAAQEMAIEL